LISSAGNAYTQRQAWDFYDTWDSNKIDSTATMWLHRVSLQQGGGPNPRDIPGEKKEPSKIGEILKNNRVINLNELTADKELVREIQSRLNAIGLLKLSDVNGIFGNVIWEDILPKTYGDPGYAYCNYFSYRSARFFAEKTCDRT
jgi:hypothetical protein